MEGRANKFWVFMTALLVTIALLLCVFASWRGSLYIKPSGNPQLTVSAFFDALRAGRYPEAYACLSDYTSLGLENEPAGEAAKLMFEALKESYDYDLVDRCQESQLEARQRVSFRYLNVKSVENVIARQVDGIVAELVPTLPKSAVYDENNDYQPEFLDTVYLTALQQVLERPELYYDTVQFDVELNYVNGQWLMKTNQNLINAIVGGLR